VPTVDYYELLGVDADATDDEIGRAFRTNAKRLHPDSRADVDTTEEFKELAAAYTVLSNHRTRRDYDATRAIATEPAPTSVPAPTARRPRWTPRRAWTALIAGTLVALLGLGVGLLTLHLRDRDAARRAHFVPITARRLGDANNDITFKTRQGEQVTTREPSQYGDPSGLGPTVTVRYDPNDPQHVIVNDNTVGRDITLAIVAVKLLVGGAVFAVLGARRLRFYARATSDSSARPRRTVAGQAS
jgi:curved DNA-binding protein CbpA